MVLAWPWSRVPVPVSLNIVHRPRERRRCGETNKSPAVAVRRCTRNKGGWPAGGQERSLIWGAVDTTSSVTRRLPLLTGSGEQGEVGRREEGEGDSGE